MVASDGSRRPTLAEAVAHLASALTSQYQRACIAYWRRRYGNDFAEAVLNEARKRLKKTAQG